MRTLIHTLFHRQLSHQKISVFIFATFTKVLVYIVNQMNV